MSTPQAIHCKRVYDPPSRSDGYRVLVDRVWPRGTKKTDLSYDEWYKELAPSTELRKWFGHDPKLWAAFYQRYHVELDARGSAVKTLLEASGGRPLTLLYSAHDTEHNNAVALKMYLENLPAMQNSAAQQR